jgi:hypothetical protein
MDVVENAVALTQRGLVAEHWPNLDKVNVLRLMGVGMTEGSVAL